MKTLLVAVAFLAALCGKAVSAETSLGESVLPSVCHVDPEFRSAAGKEIEELRREQRRLLLRLKAEIKAIPPSDKRKKLAESLASIEREIQREDGTACPIPDRTARTYLEEVFNRIEECGTRNFPTHDGKKLYGKSSATIVIAKEGALASSFITEPSDVPKLDEHVLRLVSASAPFGMVPRSILDARFQGVRIEATFRFSHEDLPDRTNKPKVRCSL